jgi:ATP-binding cassette subfamily B protein
MTTLLHDAIPQNLQSQWASLNIDAAHPRFCCIADLTADGIFDTSCVAVANDHVIRLDPSCAPCSWPLEALDDIEIEELFGSARLVAKHGDTHVILACYSRNRITEFAALCRVLNDLKEQREVILPDEHQPAMCPDCSAPLPDRGLTCPLCLSRRSVAIRLLKVLRPYRRQAILLVSASTAAVACAMVPPYTYKMIADRVLQDGVRDELALWVGIMLAAFVAEAGFKFMTNWINGWLGARVVADMRSRLHARAQQLRMTYHQRHESGELVSRVMHDTGDLQHFLIDGLPYFLVNLLSFAAIAAILLSLNWKLALLVFIPVPLLLLGGRFFWGWVRPMFHKHGNRIGTLHTMIGESLGGIRAVKSMAQEQRRANEFDHANERLFSVTTTLDRSFSSFFSTMSLTMALGTVMVWYFGGGAIVDASKGRGSMQLGTLLAFVGYMALFYGPLQWFAAVFNWASNALTSAERIFAVLDQPVESYNSENAQRLTDLKAEICFDDVRFSYERGREVIKGVTLKIPAGTMIGLVGKSGAGKSTMINLVCRFFDPDSGCIRVDGHDLRDLDLEWWRKRVGIVMQDPFLFNATILENIRYGDPSAQLDDVVRATRAARAHHFICELEEGYDTVIGDGGVGLSGGQRQRLAIARAILHDPPVLILDEATSAVDSETEKEIQEALTHLVQGRTTIAIAHRLATLRNADQLVVIEDGEIVEQGSHEELMTIPEGHFAKLVKLQGEINQLRAEQMAWKE